LAAARREGPLSAATSALVDLLREAFRDMTFETGLL
jgi:hypothetical protein